MGNGVNDFLYHTKFLLRKPNAVIQQSDHLIKYRVLFYNLFPFLDTHNLFLDIHAIIHLWISKIILDIHCYLWVSKY